jgi:hypothetical protein
MPALFGTQASNAFFNSISYNNFTIKNLTIMVAQNIGNGGPSMGGIDMYYAAGLVTDNIGVYADGSIFRSVKPTNEVAGIVFPQKESEIQSVCNNTQVVNFKYGIIGFDGLYIPNALAFVCNHAFVFPSNAENIQVGYIKPFWCINDVYFPNTTICGVIPAGKAYVNITNLHTEIFNTGVWYGYNYIVSDTGNNAVANIAYTVAVAGGTFNNSLYNVYNGSGILSQAIGSPAGTPSLDNVLATNNSSARAINLTGYSTQLILAKSQLQPLSALNFTISNNATTANNGGLFTADTTGASAWIQLVQGDILGRVVASVSTGGSITPLNAFCFNVDKSGFVGGNGAAQGSTNGWINWNTTGQLGLGTAYNANAQITLPASTSSLSQILYTGSAVDPSTGLTNGMMWYNSTTHALNFRDNGATVNLLSSATGVTTVGTFSGSSQTNGASISTNTITFGPADGTNPGMVTTGTQTFAGNKLMTGSLDIGGASAGPGPKFTLDGNVSSTSSATTHGFWFTLTRGNTYTEGSSGTLGTGASAWFGDETWAAGSATTYTIGSTLFINGPPAAGTNVTITTPYSLFIFSGNTFTGGSIFTGSNQSINSGHFVGNSVAPTIAAGAGAGTSPTVSIAGTDQSGVITVTTGTLPTASATVATITYNFAYPNATYPVLMPANSSTALLSGATMVFTTGGTTTFVITGGTTGLTAATTYSWYYTIGGR